MTSEHLLGIDIGGSKVLAVVLDARDDVVGQARATTQPGTGAVVSATLDAVRRALLTSGVDEGAVTAVGVGVPGVIEPGSGASRHAVNLGLAGETLDLAAALRRELDVRVIVENDVNAAALGAYATQRRSHSFSTDTHRGDLGVVSIGTGLAAGVVITGSIHRGNRRAAGEIGHLPLDPVGLLCSCGQRGCLETVASRSALVAAWDAVRNSGPVGDADVWRAVGDEDPAAVEVVSRFAHGVASVVRLLVLTWDLDQILLAGGVTDVGQPLLDAVRHELDEMGRQSSFVQSLDLSNRVGLVPFGVPVAAIGAALASREVAIPLPLAEFPVAGLVV